MGGMISGAPLQNLGGMAQKLADPLTLRQKPLSLAKHFRKKQ